MLIKRLHQVLGYLLVITAKYNYLSRLVKRQSPLLWVFLAFEIICLLILLYLKFFPKKLTQTGKDRQLILKSKDKSSEYNQRSAREIIL